MCLYSGGRGAKAELSLRKKEKRKKNSVRNANALCFMIKTWARHKTTETALNTVWRLAAVGG